ncbi:MAG: hypothetical protein HRU75_03400 [Planctomycetia bacterium]|nr:MAG: hypothetical protein HRU75_03400 [Planctomycetia bacterium]
MRTGYSSQQDRFRGLLAILAAGMLSAATVHAQLPGASVTYQGQLKSGGAPLDSTADFEFRLFDAAMDGNAIGTAVAINNVAVVNGLFAIDLDFGAAAFNGQARWIEAAVRSPAGAGAFTTLAPRQPVTAAPYALFSAAPWGTSGSNVFYSGGNVGIGTNTPQSALQVTGLIISGLAGVTNGEILLEDSGAITNNAGIRTNADGDLILRAHSSPGAIEFEVGNPESTRMVVLGNGNVGIGTTTPGNSLQVEGGIRVRGGTPGGSGVNNNGYAFGSAGGDNDSGMFSTADGLLQFFTNNVERLRISSAGDVGIGLTAPTARLDVEASRDVFSAPVMRMRNTNGGATGGHAFRAHAGTGESSMSTFTTWPASAIFADNNSSAGGSSAIRATTRANRAVSAYADTGVAVYGEALDSGGGGTGTAARFFGPVDVNGLLSKSGGSFKIDHPLDPENKYLSHSFVESPDMMNIYNGIIITDADGYATVTLPDWFEALNREFRYQLTVIDETDGPEFVQAKIVSGVSRNCFRIRSSAPRTQISWQVTGVRKDPWAEANRIPVEEPKKEGEIGKYRNPELYGHDRSKRINVGDTDEGQGRQP